MACEIGTRSRPFSPNRTARPESSSVATMKSFAFSVLKSLLRPFIE